MNNHAPQNSQSPSHDGAHDSVVVLAIPRHMVKFGAVMVGLVALSIVSVMAIYRLLDARDANSNSQPGYPLPQPVTFVPPSPEGRSSEGRFDVSADDDPALGPADAPVVIIEFSDYQCYYCGVFARERLHHLLELYPEQVRFVYRDFVFYGPVSRQAAIAAECADEQDAFWLYHDLLFEFQNELDRERMTELARSIDLDMDAFVACMDDPAMAAEVEQDTRDGARALVNGTPTFYINGRILVGAQPLDVFADMIDEELALIVPNETATDEGNATDGP